MPALQFWTTPAGALAALSLFVASAIGLLGIKMVIPRRTYWSLWICSVLLAAFAWYANARQAQDGANDRIELLAVFNRANPKSVSALPANAPGWVHAAYKEIGQTEIGGPEENPRIAEYFRSIDDGGPYRDDRDDWASAFAEWCLQQAGKNGPHSIKPSVWLKWGHEVATPTVGTIVVLNFSGLEHVGFYISEDDELVRILGGNQNDSVSIFRYPKTGIVGYRAPM